MTAYVICIRDRTLDPAELDAYAQLARLAREDRQMVVRARYGHCESWEGPEAEGVALLEFPSASAAREWYNSAEYQRAKSHRRAAADYRFILFTGVDEG